MSKKFLCVLALVLAVYVYFSGLGSYGFFDPDEGRYSEIPREMIESGDFITPRLNYVKYFEKPIMHYWLTSAAFMTLGQNEFAGRFFPVVLGLAGCVLTYFLALKISGDKASAFFSGIILASSTLWFALSRINITDMTLTFFFTLALFSCRFWLDDVGKKFWLIIFYIAMAFAVMTKGLIGVVLPGGIAVVYAVLTGQSKKILTRIFSPVAIIIFFAVCAVWFVPVCMRNSDFFDFFFIREHLLRYTTKIHDRYQPFYFFIPIIIGGFVPWTGLMWDAFKAKIINRDDKIFLCLWFFMTFIFFSFSNSKLVTYILPCLPPLAILAGSCLEKFKRGEFRNFIIISSVTILPLALVGFYLYFFYAGDDTDIFAMALPIIRLSVALVIFYAASWLLLFRDGVCVKIFLCVLAVLVMYSTLPAFNVEADLLSHKDAAEIIKKEINPDNNIDVVVFQKLMQGMGYYLERRTITADTIDELEFGAAQETSPKWFINREELQKLWDSDKKIVAVARAKNIHAIRDALKNPVRTWATSADVVFANF